MTTEELSDFGKILDQCEADEADGRCEVLNVNLTNPDGVWPEYVAVVIDSPKGAVVVRLREEAHWVGATIGAYDAAGYCIAEYAHVL